MAVLHKPQVIRMLTALLIPAAFVALWTVTELSQPPVWSAPLQAYIAHLDSTLPGTTTVERVERARWPQEFTAGMSQATFGDGPHYHIQYGRGGSLPVPYPPRKLWCALLLRTPGPPGEPERQLVFVAEHHDLYNADILVHSSPLGESQEGVLQRLGCETLLGQSR